MELPILWSRARCQPWSNGLTASLRCSTLSEAPVPRWSRGPAHSRRRRYSPRHIRPAPPRSSCLRDGPFRTPSKRMKTGPSPKKSPPPWSPCGERGSSNMCSIPICRGMRKSGPRGRDMNACRRAHGPLASCSPSFWSWTCGPCCRRSACRFSSFTTPTISSSRLGRPDTSLTAYRGPITLNCRGATCITSLNRDGVRPPRDRRIPHRPTG